MCKSVHTRQCAVFRAHFLSLSRFRLKYLPLPFHTISVKMPRGKVDPNKLLALAINAGQLVSPTADTGSAVALPAVGVQDGGDDQLDFDLFFLLASGICIPPEVRQFMLRPGSLC